MTFKRRTLAPAVAIFLLVAPAASAQAPQPDEAQLGVARELLVVMKAAANVDAILPTVMNAIKPVVVGSNPKAAKDWDELAPMMMAEMSSLKTQMLDDVAAIYAKAFTRDELNSFVAFYKTPAGAKLATLNPTLAQQTMQAGQRWGQQAAGRIAERMKEELRKRGNTL